MKALYINTNRLGYTPEQCPRTMTVGDLIDYLSEFDEDGGFSSETITVTPTALWMNAKSSCPKTWKKTDPPDDGREAPGRNHPAASRARSRIAALNIWGGYIFLSTPP